MASSAALLMKLFLCVSLLGMVAGAIDCGDVIRSITPCMSYITGNGPLGAFCCTNITVLRLRAAATDNRKVTCGCLKDLAVSYPGVTKPFSASRNVGLKPFNPDTDCS